MMQVMQRVSPRRQLHALVLLAALALGACATTSQPPAPDYDALFASARDFADAGRTEAALNTYRRAADADPSRKEPWQQMAALNFAAGRPVSALVAAEETLQRDPGDASANEVFIASAMQIAGHAMQRLLAAGAKPDDGDLLRAQELVKKMGQVFGEDALVSNQIKARYARRAVQQYRAAQAKQSQNRVPEDKIKRRPDPLEVLGGD